MTTPDLHSQATALADGASKYELARRALVADHHRDTLVMPILRWLADDETGISSETMAFAVLGIERGGDLGTGHPLDPADFRCCVDLLEAVPAIRDHMAMIGELSPEWRRLVSNWSVLETLLRREIATGGGQAPRTYRMMKELIGKEAA